MLLISGDGGIQLISVRNGSESVTLDLDCP